MVEEFLKATEQISLLETALFCLDNNKIYLGKKPKTSLELVGLLSKYFKKKKMSPYLWKMDSRNRSQETIIQRADRFIHKGFIFQDKSYSLTVPFDWKMASDIPRNHKFKIQSWYHLYDILEAYNLTSNSAYLEISRNICVDWIDKFIFDNHQNEYAWYDMGTGLRATLLAYVTVSSILEFPLDKTKGKTNEHCDNILKLVVGMYVHKLELMDVNRLASHSNHGLFQMAGILASVKSLSVLNESDKAEIFAIGHIEKMLNKHFFADGFHKEHSPMYHLLVANFLHQLEIAQWLKYNSSLIELSQKSKQVLQTFIMPNGFFAPIGDSKMLHPAGEISMFKLSEDSLGKISAPPGTHTFIEGGVVIIATNDATNSALEHLVFSGQFHSRQHKQADDLSINFCLGGERYLIDSGNFAYEYDCPERMYIESTRAHNTIEIDGLNFSRYTRDIYGSAIRMVSKIGEVSILEGEINHRQLISPTVPNNKIKFGDNVNVDIHHRRVIIYKPENFLCILDLMKSEKSHNYKQWFHLTPELNLVPITDFLFAVKDKSGAMHSTIHHVPMDGQVSNGEICISRTTPVIQGHHSTNGIDLISNPTFNFNKFGKNCNLCTIFDFKAGKESPYVNVGSNGKYIRISIKDGEEKTDISIRETKEKHIEIKSTNPNDEYIEIVRKMDVK